MMAAATTSKTATHPLPISQGLLKQTLETHSATAAQSDIMPAETRSDTNIAATTLDHQLQVLETHTATAAQTHQVDLLPLEKLIRSIFQNAAAVSKDTGEYEKLNDIISSIQSFPGMRQVLGDIQSISCEISCNPSAGNVDENTSVLLGRLKNYPWNAKVVVAMAAFAFSVVELSMLLTHRNTDPIAQSVNILKGHSSSTLDFSVKEIKDIFNAMMEVVNTNLLFLELEPTILEDAQSKKDAMAFFPTATYNVLRIVLKVASILSRTQDNTGLSLLAKEVSDINTSLQEKLKPYKAAVKPTPYTYRSGAIPKKEEIIVAKHLIPKFGISELIDKSKNLMKIQVPETLRNRHVLFLISDLDISIEEIKVLNSLHQKNDHSYEILWLPIVDLSAYDDMQFRHLKQLMKWTVVEPCEIEEEEKEFIKKEWHFIKKTIAVTVNPEGEVTCQNALPMLWTWGNLAFPFTDEREQDLWSNINEHNGWRLGLLLDDIVPDVRSWIYSETTFVCLFGGGDISWIREFKEKVRYAAYCAGVSLKLVYVGKNKGKAIGRKELSRDINVIESELQWQFWSRLESIMYLKIRHVKTDTSYMNDQVLRKATKVVGYGYNGEAWTTFSMGPGAMVTTNGAMALTIMSNYMYWEQDKTGLSFFEGLKKYKSAVTGGPRNNFQRRLNSSTIFTI